MAALLQRNSLLEQERTQLCCSTEQATAESHYNNHSYEHCNVSPDGWNSSAFCERRSEGKTMKSNCTEASENLDNSGMFSEQCTCSRAQPSSSRQAEILRRRTSHCHVTRLKSRRMERFWHFFSTFLSTDLPSSKRSNHCSTVFISLLLLLSTLTHCSMAQASQQKSRSDSPFQSWVVADVDSHTQEHRTFRFPDFVAPVNFLFQYQIPKIAFDIENVNYYQVCL